MEEQLPTFVLAQALVRAVRAVPGVADIYGGRLGEIATYGRGGRVPGIRIRTAAGQVLVEVHLIVTYAHDLHVPALAETVREQIRQQLTTLRIDNAGAIDVVVDDVALHAAPHEARAP